MSWLGRIVRARARALLALVGRLGDWLDGWLGGWPGWLLAGVLAGVLPGLACATLGWPGQHLLTALACWPLLLAAVSQDRLDRATLTLGSAALAHAGFVFAFVALDAARANALYPPGAAYWLQTQQWIVTGQAPEYDTRNWLPAHGQLFIAVVLLSVCSLGWLPLWQGFREADLMNYYVGHLLTQSADPLTALVWGWHPWSVCRGVGYVVVVFEVSSATLAWLAGQPLSPRGRRQRRWLLGVLFLLADACLKYLCSDGVRRVLAANLN
jgi:hypothetical protein